MINKEPTAMSEESNILRDTLCEYEEDCDFAEGHRAHSQGLSIEECPYQENSYGLSGIRQAWLKGYRAAEVTSAFMNKGSSQ